ncbi:MAG: DUF5060 domain-containing protein [Phycisphaerae bacterium]|nr:DUF5060 domain-containing protein [Phycisphaerae bacterium]
MNRSLYRFDLFLVIALGVLPAKPVVAELSCRLSAKSVDAYSRIEIRFDHTFKVDNPDDPRDISVYGIFVSPKGREWRMPGFLYQDFRRDGKELHAHGKPEWRVRFTPPEPGIWKASVVVKEGRRTHRGSAGAFKVRESAAQGFLRISRRNPRAMEFENGDPFIGIGSNLVPKTWLDRAPQPWSRMDMVIRHMRRTAKAGGTLGRLPIDSFKMPIESSANTKAGYEGAGRYHRQTCWEIDQIVNEAERLGFTFILCNSCGNTQLCDQIPVDWLQYRYLLKEHGGPLDDMDQFFRHPEVKRLFKQKARYCVARWGASPAVGMWEFLNEVPLTAELSSKTTPFCIRYARYWHEKDPYERPVSVCPGQISHKPYFKKFFGSKWIDLVQYHEYWADDVDRAISCSNKDIRQWSQKPILVSEFGSAWNLCQQLGGLFSDPELDPKGVHLHNGIWSAGMTGSVGALPWFVFPYIEKLDLFDVYTGFSRFARDWRINEGPWKTVDVETDNSGFGDQRWGTLQLPIRLGWQRSEADTITVHRDGRHKGAPLVNVWLYGPKPHRELRRPPTFKVDYPVAGQFVAHVWRVEGKSGHPAPLVIKLNGREALRREFTLGKGQGKKAEYNDRYGTWSVEYGERITIDVPAGRHRIGVEYQGDGQLRLDSYELRHYVDAGYVVRAMALDGEIRLWIRNGRNTYANHFRGEGPTLSPLTTLRIPVTRQGAYEVQWWDTVKGHPTRRETASSRKGHLEVAYPGTLTDEACVIRHVESRRRER